jgi:hypothetical protein
MTSDPVALLVNQHLTGTPLTIRATTLINSMPIISVMVGPCLQRFRLFGQLPGRNKLKSPGSRLLVSPFPEIKFILSCCGVL